MDDDKIARDAIRRDNERQRAEAEKRKAVDRPAWARDLDLSGDPATDDGLSHMYSSYRSVLRRLADTEVELAHARAEVVRLKAAPLLAARRFRRDQMIGQCDAVDKQTAQRIIAEHARAPQVSLPEIGEKIYLPSPYSRKLRTVEGARDGLVGVVVGGYLKWFEAEKIERRSPLMSV